MGEWQECEHCSTWLFHSSSAKSSFFNVGDYLGLIHRPEGRFFCTPCFETCVDIDGERYFCATCGTGTRATAYEVDRGASFDEHKQRHCCQCWE